MDEHHRPAIHLARCSARLNSLGKATGIDALLTESQQRSMYVTLCYRVLLFPQPHP